MGVAQKRFLVFVTRSGGFPTSSFVKGSCRRWSMALRAVLLAHSSLNAFCSEIHFGLPITFSVLQYLVGSAQLCLLRRCHSVYVSCQCFTDSVVSTLLSNFVPICWHLDIHVRVERIFLFAAYYWYRALKSKMLAFNFVTKTFSFNFVTKTLSFQLRHDFLQLF